MRTATLTPTVEIRPKCKGVGVFALCRIGLGEEISRVQGQPREEPTRFTLQVDGSLHLDLGEEVPAKMNHSCEPNAVVRYTDIRELAILALRDIDPGEEVRINYCASEEKMAEPFQCNCGSDGCYGMVGGFAYLDTPRKKELGGLLSPFLEERYRTG